MTSRTDLARDAVRGFATKIQEGPRPDRICVRIHGADGMASLCAVEDTIVELWPPTTAKELIWLTRTAAADTVRLQAFAGGALVAESTYSLGGADV